VVVDTIETLQTDCVYSSMTIIHCETTLGII